MKHILLALAITILGTSLCSAEDELKLLFLGDQRSHKPATRFEILKPVMAEKGIALTYTEDVDSLNLETLNQYDGLFLYANIDAIEPEQVKALLDYVASGKGFVPIHCATFCFRNSPEVVALMGAQFQRHGGEEMTTQSSGVDHPITDGYKTFSSWDETYVHHLHNDKNRTVLEYRIGGMQAEGKTREPWTWIRTHGKGRVFYTAWGHDERTWNKPGYHNLLERGIRWACGEGDAAMAESQPAEFNFPVPKMTAIPKDVKPFEYVDVGAEIPNYTPSRQWGVQGKPMNMMQKPLSPEESMKHMSVPEGFHVELFVSEPDLKGKPICMAWDERGRLWVAETYDYPNELQPPDQGRDRIRICEDTDSDGRADKFTVFAEKLSIPTSIAFHRGGAIVQNGVETLYLKDTNGDDVADERRVMFSGWELGDTHGGVSNFQYGLDNWIWAMQGYNNSKPKTPDATDNDQQSFRMGFFRFKPDGSEIEFIRSTNNNTWGLGISEEGLIFGSTANRNPSNFMPISNRYYERVRGWAPSLTLEPIAPDHYFKPITDKVRQVDHHGGFTAAAGHALYTAREYPQEYWNRTAFVCGPTGKLVATFVLEPDGAGFKSKNMFNLLASDDEWTAPIMAEVGPDGNVWVIDWYNYVVQHNPTPEGFKTGKGRAYETKLRDKKHGRIYRIVYDGDKRKKHPYKPVDLSKAAPDELVAALTNPTMLVRKHAQRLLVEKGETDVADSLHKLVNDQNVDEVGSNTNAIHALWTLKGLGLLSDPKGSSFKLANNSLFHSSATVRLNAVRVLPDNPTSSIEILHHAHLFTDENEQVVLAMLLALSDISSPEQGKTLAELILQEEPSTILSDRWLRDAAICSAANHAASFLTEVLRQSDEIELSKTQLDIVRIVAEHFARQKPGADQLNQMLASFGAASPIVIAATLEGIQSGWPADHEVKIAKAENAKLQKLFERAPPQSKGMVVRLAKLWGSDALDGESAKVMSVLSTQVEDEKLDISDRINAAKQLVEFDAASEESLASLSKLIRPLSPPELSAGLIDVVSRSAAPELGDQLIAIDAQATPAIREALIKTMLSRPALTQRLLKAIETGDMQLSDLSAIQRQILADHPNRQIRRLAREVIAAGGAMVESDRAKIVEEKLSLASKTGDPDAGKLVFTKNCATCHVFGGEGNVVGPNLTGMSVHPKTELLTHILDPSRSVESNFRLYSVETIDGLTIAGLLASESRTAVEIVDTQGKRHSILREDIEELTPSRKSAMPEGIEATVDDKGLTDLLEYLTQKGDFVPLPLEKVATTVTSRGMFYDRNSTAERLVFDDWKPKTFENVPFILVDPQGEKVNNAIMLHGPNGPFAPTMPKSVSLPCNTPAKAIHVLGGIAGWASQGPGNRGVSMIVRLRYADGKTEDHPLVDGQHIADYIGRFNVPKSKLAFDLNGRQVRYLAIKPKRTEKIETIELVKPEHNSAPVVMAVTVEIPTSHGK